MAVPKRKTSKARKNSRRSSVWKLTQPALEKCPNCGKLLFRKKGKALLVCHDKDCGFKRESEEVDTESKA